MLRLEDAVGKQMRHLLVVAMATLPFLRLLEIRPFLMNEDSACEKGGEEMTWKGTFFRVTGRNLLFELVYKPLSRNVG